MRRDRQAEQLPQQRERGWYTDPPGHKGPPHLRLADEIVPVRDFTVALCRLSEYFGFDADRAQFVLVAVSCGHWYHVSHSIDLEGARRMAEQMERPCARTHGLSLTRVTRTASLTPEIYRLTGQSELVTNSLNVRWAPPGSAFKAGAEYDSPLDARYPRWVTQADLDADTDRRAELYPLLQPRMVDACDLSAEVYDYDDGQEGMSPAPCR